MMQICYLPFKLVTQKLISPPDCPPELILVLRSEVVACQRQKLSSSIYKRWNQVRMYPKARVISVITQNSLQAKPNFKPTFLQRQKIQSLQKLEFSFFPNLSLNASAPCGSKLLEWQRTQRIVQQRRILAIAHSVIDCALKA